jgi:hypothetical protein
MKPIFVSMALLFAPSVALGQNNHDRTSCDSEDSDRAIPACSRLIEAGRLATKEATKDLAAALTAGAWPLASELLRKSGEADALPLVVRIHRHVRRDHTVFLA